MEDMEVDESFNLSSEMFDKFDYYDDNPVPTLCRKLQWEQLVKVFGGDDRLQKTPRNNERKIRIPRAIFVWGQPSTGKSTVIEDALQTAQVKHTVRTSAFDLLIGQREFYEEILNGLNDTEAGVKTVCTTSYQFLEGFKELNIEATERIVIVIENAELLRTDHSDVLSMLLLVQEETGLNICIVLCSSVPMLTYNSCVFDMKIIPQIHFPQYKLNELQQLLRNEYEKLYKESKFFEDYLKFFLDMNLKFCKDFRKLSRMFHESYKDFLEQPYVLTAKSFVNCWTHVKDQFKGNISVPPSTDSREIVARNLPILAKFVLVAAFLASKNPVSSDPRFFVKNRISKKKPKVSMYEEFESNKAKDFVHSRLIAIVASLRAQRCYKLDVTTGFLSVISTLCKLGFLERVGSNILDDCKYRCKADFDVISRLGMDIGFSDLKNYLY